MLNIEGGWYADCTRTSAGSWRRPNRGKLFGPFDSRFTKVELDMYGAEEIAAIVRIDNPEWDLDAVQDRRQVLPAASPARPWTSPRRWCRRRTSTAATGSRWRRGSPGA